MNRDERRTSHSRKGRETTLDMDDFAAARQARRKKTGWRKRRIFSLWARLGMLGAVILVTIFLAISLVTKALRPYREAGLQSTQLSATREESDALATENSQLARRIAYLQTPEGIASEARKMGYLHPGEIPIVVEGERDQTYDTGALPTPPPVESKPTQIGAVAVRFWRNLTGH